MDWTLFTKLISVVAIYGVAFLGGLIPIKLTHWFSEAKTLSYANCLSGGILFGAALIHLLYDAEFKTEQYHFDYPIAHLFCGAGFLAAFMLEKIAFSHNHEHSKLEETDKKNKSDPKESLSHNLHSSTPHYNQQKLDLGTARTPNSNELDSLTDQDGVKQVAEEEEEISLDFTEETIHPDHSKENSAEHSHSHNADENPAKTAYILFAVLSLESAISGSALGVANDTLGAIVLFVAIITHIWAESFALCANLLKAKVALKRILLMIGIFSGVTPIGIFVGMILKTILSGYVAVLISSSLIAFAAGTFLYVAAVEVVAEEFENGQNKWTKLNLLLIGFAFMSALAVWI